jgi:hypothetical protein
MTEDSRKPHFHIRWTPGSFLDWQRFLTRAEAEEHAGKRVRVNERYSIEEFDDLCCPCPSCIDVAEL